MRTKTNILLFISWSLLAISFSPPGSANQLRPSEDISVANIEKFLSNAALDAWHPRTNEVIFMRRDNQGIWQLHKVDEMAENPEAEAVPLSTQPLRVVGLEPTWIPRLHKGSSDWHPSGEWFVTQVEIPNNISWKYIKTMPEARALAEPGAGWWNNLFLVKADGSLWIKLTDFTAEDLESGVLYPKFSVDGTRLCWAEKIGPAQPFDRYPFAQWVLKTARIDWSFDEPQLVEIRTHSLRQAAILEPQFWTTENKIIFAADHRYQRLPYPAYRLDLWEAELDRRGHLRNFRNLTKTRGYYEEQASLSPDKNFIAFMANLFDSSYESRLTEAWKNSGSEMNSFIVQQLSTDLYLMDRRGKLLTRLTYFADEDWRRSHPLVTRRAWSVDGRTLLLSLTLRDNFSGKKVDESIYRLELAY